MSSLTSITLLHDPEPRGTAARFPGGDRLQQIQVRGVNTGVNLEQGVPATSTSRPEVTSNAAYVQISAPQVLPGGTGTLRSLAAVSADE